MHDWSDKSVDWKGVGDAAEYIETFCKRWARLGGQSKEKYGTVRFYANFGVFNLLSLTHPGYCHYGPYPKWLIHFDIYYSPTIFKWSGLAWIFSKIQPAIYSKAYINAIHRWPHLRAEILVDADYVELIKGVTRREGNDLHVLGWNGEIISTWTTS